jgi:hypothetical protein
MRVESSRIFSIVAHELRSPLGVIQGYIRMLRMRHGDDEQDAKMLTAMLDATARIAAVARQASELALWEEGQDSGAGVRVPLGDLVGRVAAGQLPRPLVATVPEGMAARPVTTPNVEALAAAITAIAVAVVRNTPQDPVGLRASDDGGGGLLLILGKESRLPSGRDVGEVGDAARLLEAGGQGLSLVLAALVLNRHGIGVGLLEPAPPIVVLRLPKSEVDK